MFHCRLVDNFPTMSDDFCKVFMITTKTLAQGYTTRSVTNAYVYLPCYRGNGTRDTALRRLLAQLHQNVCRLFNDNPKTQNKNQQNESIHVCLIIYYSNRIVRMRLVR